jgi:hypothetical protein
MVIAKTTAKGRIKGDERVSLELSGCVVSVIVGEGDGVGKAVGVGVEETSGVGVAEDNGKGNVVGVAFTLGVDGEGEVVMVGEACGVEKLNGGVYVGAYPVSEAVSPWSEYPTLSHLPRKSKSTSSMVVM